MSVWFGVQRYRLFFDFGGVDVVQKQHGLVVVLGEDINACIALDDIGRPTCQKPLLLVIADEEANVILLQNAANKLGVHERSRIDFLDFVFHGDRVLIDNAKLNKKCTQKQKRTSFEVLFVVIRLGFEPKTHSLEGCCSIQLSYQTIALTAFKSTNGHIKFTAQPFDLRCKDTAFFQCVGLSKRKISNHAWNSCVEGMKG